MEKFIASTFQAEKYYGHTKPERQLVDLLPSITEQYSLLLATHFSML
jgi:hypothetical protein